MNTIIYKNIDKIREYCKTYNVKELYAVGSVVTDNFTADSDIDLLIEFKPISIDEYTNNYFILHSLFKKVFNREIDLITNKSLSNPFFIKSLESTKQLIYAG